MNNEQVDQRYFHRISVKRPVHFWAVGDDPLPGDTVDLSAGGMLIASRTLDDAFLDALIASSDVIQLRIQLEEGDSWFRCRSKVVWIDPGKDGFLMRVCFVDLEPEDEDRLHRFLAPLCGILNK